MSLYVTLVCLSLLLCTTLTAGDPSPCCIPDELETSVIKLGSVRHGDEFFGMVRLSYDFTNSRVAVQDVMSEKKVIVDFSAGMAYMSDDDGCVSKIVDKPMKQICIPNDASYEGEFSLGVDSNNQAWFDSWTAELEVPEGGGGGGGGSAASHPHHRRPRPTTAAPVVAHGGGTSGGNNGGGGGGGGGGEDELHAAFTVTKDEHCMITTATVLGRVRGHGVFVVSTMLNTTVGINDPSVFDAPGDCPLDTEDDGDDDESERDFSQFFIPH